MGSGWRGLDPAPSVAFCAVFCLILCLPAVLNDGDTFWLIRAGEWILDHRALPYADPFAYTTAGLHWYAHEWGAEVLLALAWRAGGMAGIMVLTAAAIGSTAALLMHRLRAFLPSLYASLGLLVALSNAAGSMLARPHVLSWPFLCIWCGGLVAARARKAAPSRWLILALVPWVNLHGSFPAGLVLAGALAIEAFVEPGADRLRVLRDWGVFLALSGVACLANPEFLAGALFPLRMLGLKAVQWTGDWGPTNFSQLQPLELVILGAIGLGMGGGVRLPPIRLILLLGLIHSALAHQRHDQLLGLIGALILAEPLGAALGRAAAPSGGRGGLLIPAAVVIAIVGAILRLSAPLGPNRTGAAFAAAMAHVPDAVRSKPVLNDFVLGGELIFDGERPFIDSRTDLYSEDFELLYRRLMSPDRATLEKTLSDYGIAWTVFRSDRPVAQLLDTEPGWRRLGTFDGMAVHVRTE